MERLGLRACGVMVCCFPAACQSPDPSTPHLVGAIEVAPLDTALPLLRTVSFTTDAPAVPTWTLTSGDHRVEQTLPEGTSHHAALLGLRPGRVYTSTLRLDGRHGSRTLVGPDLASGTLPDTFPHIDVLAWSPERMEPGVTLINLTTPFDGEDDALTHVVLFDNELEPVWYLQSADAIGYTRWEEGLWGISGGVGMHWSVDGHLDRRLTPSGLPGPSMDIDVPLDVDRILHYDLLPTDQDSFFSLVFDSFEVDAYPLSSEEPEVVPNPQTLRDMVVVELGFDGSSRNRWPLSERLDTGRISFSSHDPSVDGLDWAHSNAVAHDPDGGVLVSSRHQDAIVALDERGDVRWILSNPDGWRSPWAELRLSPVGEVQWPFHQHAPQVGEDGVLVVFDNGNVRSTPYQPSPQDEEPYSRVVGYRVDAQAMTVEQVFSFEETVTGRLFSSALGDADPQPLTGNVLATYNMLTEEGGVSNLDRGLGRLTVRLIELEPDSLDTVLDLRFSTDSVPLPRGVRSFRADRVPLDALPWRPIAP